MDEQRFVESEWDYAIILDAARYDVFEDIYDDYLDGTLEKRRSVGSSTPEWAYRNFTGDHDIAYFSANPFINDLGIPLNELKWGASCDYEWTASDHISKVVDVWKHEWDDTLGTVPPDGLERAFRDYANVVAEAERTVLHYMQPHTPYLGYGNGGKLERIRKGIRKQDETDDSGGLLSRLTDSIRPWLESTLERSELAMKAGLWLELDSMAVFQNGTRETAMEQYEQNLRIVLEEVADLVSELDGTVVVTADHGEAFGEEGIWEHHIETYIPELMEVPWLELN